MNIFDEIKKASQGLMNQQQNPESVPKEVKKFDPYEKITKKVAAIEVLKHLQLAYHISIVSIIFFILVPFLNIFSQYISIIAVIIIVIAIALYAGRTRQEIIRLNNQYMVKKNENQANI